MRPFRGAYKNIKHVTLRSDMPLPRGLEELPSLATVLVRTSTIWMSSTSSFEPPNDSRLVIMAYGYAHRAIDRLKQRTMTSPVTVLVKLWIRGCRSTSECVSGGIEQDQHILQWDMSATVNVTERMIEYKMTERQSSAP